MCVNNKHTDDNDDTGGSIMSWFDSWRKKGEMRVWVTVLELGYRRVSSIFPVGIRRCGLYIA